MHRPSIDPRTLFDSLRNGSLKDCPVCGGTLRYRSDLVWLNDEQSQGAEGWYKETVVVCPVEDCTFSAAFATPYTPTPPPHLAS